MTPDRMHTRARTQSSDSSRGTRPGTNLDNERNFGGNKDAGTSEGGKLNFPPLAHIHQQLIHGCYGNGPQRPKPCSCSLSVNSLCYEYSNRNILYYTILYYSALPYYRPNC